MTNDEWWLSWWGAEGGLEEWATPEARRGVE